MKPRLRAHSDGWMIASLTAIGKVRGCVDLGSMTRSSVFSLFNLSMLARKQLRTEAMQPSILVIRSWTEMVFDTSNSTSSQASLAKRWK